MDKVITIIVKISDSSFQNHCKIEIMLVDLNGKEVWMPFFNNCKMPCTQEKIIHTINYHILNFVFLVKHGEFKQEGISSNSVLMFKTIGGDTIEYDK